MITITPLTAAMAVNAQVVCDCGNITFEIGIAVNRENGNNFIRVMQCCACRKQMPATHQSNAEIEPSIMSGRLVS